MIQKKKSGNRGYTLVELMVVITIMAVLAAAATGIYAGYVKRAREAALYEIAGQIKDALAICEAEYAESGSMEESVFWTSGFLNPPNHPDSVLYPYVGDMTEDCTGYSLKVGKEGDDRYHITGFTYQTSDYEIQWKKSSGITVKEK